MKEPTDLPQRARSRRVWAARIVGVGAAVAYCWMAVHLPVLILSDGLHDDLLFVRLARDLADGRWLGVYDQFTLMKGPGYPLFLAVNAWLGLPVTATQALLHCAAAAGLGWLVARVGGSKRLGFAVGLALLALPVGLEPLLRRLFRDAVYVDQVAIAFVLWGAALTTDGTLRRRLSLAVAAGTWTGWVWLSREEGLWLLPMLGLGAAIALSGRRGRSGRLDLAVTLAVAASCVLVVLGGFRAANLVHYGKWVGVEIHDRDFRAAMASLQSVRAGEPVRRVPVTRAMREAIYAVSPTFSSLRLHLDPVTGPIWQDGCAFYPETCGEIAGGWFLWALRGASAKAGFFSSPAAAAGHFRAIADEVEAACADGRLRCADERRALMPAVSSRELETAPRRAWAASRIMALLDEPPEAASRSRGSPARFERMLDLTNHPARQPRSGADRTVWISGWFYKRANAWFRARIEQPDGSRARLAVERLPSKSLVGFFRDPRATDQRFEAEGECLPGCALVVTTDGGASVRIPLVNFEGGGRGFRIGRGAIHIDAVEFDAEGFAERPAAAARVAFDALWNVYRTLLAPVLVLGAMAAVLALVHALRARRSRGADPLLALAVVAWCGVVTRIALVVAIDLSAFPALLLQYLAPATCLALVAALTSIAAAYRGFRSVAVGRATSA